jgi:hypothetical protein
MGFYSNKRAFDPKWVAGDDEHEEALAECGVGVEAACRIRPLPTRWLVQDVVPQEAVTIIAGAAGAGKTFFGCQLAADAARQRQYRVILATSGYERPELLRWRLDRAQGDARRVVIATLKPPKGIKDRRQTPSDEDITERLSMLHHLIEATGDLKSGVLPEMSVVSGPLSVSSHNEGGTRRQGDKETRRNDGDARNGPRTTDNGPRTTDNGPQPVRLVVIDDVDGWFGEPGGMLPAAALARIIERLNELAVMMHVAIVVLARVQLSVEGRITARQLSRIAHAASVVWVVAKDREERESPKSKVQSQRMRTERTRRAAAAG